MTLRATEGDSSLCPGPGLSRSLTHHEASHSPACHHGSLNWLAPLLFGMQVLWGWVFMFNLGYPTHQGRVLEGADRRQIIHVHWTCLCSVNMCEEHAETWLCFLERSKAQLLLLEILLPRDGGGMDDSGAAWTCTRTHTPHEPGQYKPVLTKEVLLMLWWVSFHTDLKIMLIMLILLNSISYADILTSQAAMVGSIKSIQRICQRLPLSHCLPSSWDTHPQSPSFLGQWTRQLFPCCNKVPDARNLKKERFILLAISEDSVHGYLTPRQELHGRRMWWRKAV